MKAETWEVVRRAYRQFQVANTEESEARADLAAAQARAKAAKKNTDLRWREYMDIYDASGCTSSYPTRTYEKAREWDAIVSAGAR